MQTYYPPTTTTQNEKIVYVPVYTPNVQTETQAPPPPLAYTPPTVASETQSEKEEERTHDTKEIPFFERFWVTENGVISVSVRNLTVIGCMILTVNLLANLYVACEYELVECTFDNFPGISSVVGLPLWDRLICLTATFYCMGP